MSTAFFWFDDGTTPPDQPITHNQQHPQQHPQQQQQPQLQSGEEDDDPLIWMTGSSSSMLDDITNDQASSLPAQPSHLLPQQTSSSTHWEAISTTPMTSRPHFIPRLDANDNSHDNVSSSFPIVTYPMRRVRSRSLGSSPAPPIVARPWGHWQDLWIPQTTPQTQCLATPRLATGPTATRTTQTSQTTLPTALSDSRLPESALSSLASPRTLSLPLAMSDSYHPASSPRKTTKSPIAVPTAATQSTTTEPNPFWISLLYGLINATIVLPVLMSFASIIYREQAFQPYLARLIKLTLVSGMVHQVTFSTFSSLPFCVGQVQDAGLIFLSGMATTIVDYCDQYHLSDQVLLATTTVALSLGTALLGLGLVGIGQCGLAQYVQMLPTSVVGGYLAYIGWFCGLAGVGLMAGESQVTMDVVIDSWYLIGPGIAGGIMVYVLVRWLRHMAVLPCSILALLVMFYLTLWMTGTSVKQATEQGWIRDSSAMGNGDQEEVLTWKQTWDYLQFDLVAWGVLPRLFLTELSMIFVVAMSSSLDVAAIELELKRPLDYNGELKMVGLSNLISGLTGGYTGSYIFSQSIFSLRAGITSRAAGFVLAFTQLIFFWLPFPILSYVPNFFFGSLLVMICVDLMYEWLWDVRQKVTPVEYVVCLSTFGLIQAAGVEFGILLGALLYAICYKIGLSVGVPKHASTSPQEVRTKAANDERNDETMRLLASPKNELQFTPKGNEYHYGGL